jgi:hypothetical protein
MVIEIVLGIGVGILVTFTLEQVLQRNKRLRNEFWEYHKPILGFHVHHSTFGIPVILLGLSLFPRKESFLLIGIGLGIIIMHTITSREFIFIERSYEERKNRLADKK